MSVRVAQDFPNLKVLDTDPKTSLWAGVGRKADMTLRSLVAPTHQATTTGST